MTYDNTYKPARRICGTMALIILLTLAARTATAQTTFHVTPDGTQGSTAWTDAMTLTEALDAARAGDPPLYREEEGRFCPAGTINLMILVNCSLPDGIMARALITVTEGKTAALQDAGIASVYTGLPATGTATDGVILVTDPEAPRLTDAGTYSLLGSLLASAARDAVAYCISHYKRPWNQFDSLRTPPAVPLPKE